MNHKLYLLPTLFFSLAGWVFAETAKPVDVYTARVQEESLFESIMFAGKLLPANSWDLVAETSGIVENVYKYPGDIVKAGEKLLAIRPMAAGGNYRPYVVRASQLGRILTPVAAAGTAVNKGQQLTTLGSTRRFKIPFAATSVDRSILANIRSFKLRIPGISQVGLVASLHFLSPMADNGTGIYRGEFQASCAGISEDICRKLPLGSLVKVTGMKNLRKGIKVHQKHVVSNGSKVMLVKDGKVEFRSVELGESYGAEVEVVSGLKAGEQMITSYARYPRKGESARVITKKASRLKDSPKG